MNSLSPAAVPTATIGRPNPDNRQGVRKLAWRDRKHKCDVSHGKTARECQNDRKDGGKEGERSLKTAKLISFLNTLSVKRPSLLQATA
jgi:hypothetical protein